MEHYRDSLRHIVRPEDPSDRRNVDDVVHLFHYEALYVRGALYEWSQYGAENEEEADIALGLVEYIDMTVHDERKSEITIFLHTERARKVLEEAVSDRSHVVDDLHENVVLTVGGSEDS